MIPNLLVGLISVFAILYGLHRDLTPFSMMMAGFAALNAGFMFFSLYLATGLTNENRILRDRFPGLVRFFLRPAKNVYRKISRFVFRWTRRAALPVLLLGALLTAYSLDKYLYHQWEGITPGIPKPRKGPDYTGIFYPSKPGGITDMDTLRILEAGLERDFDLISLYVAWGDGPSNQMPKALVEEVLDSHSWPMITWEPWMNDFRAADTIPRMKDNQKVFQQILEGQFDGYIDSFAGQLASLQAPVFLRFAHEFDNPAYPWSETGGNNPEEFIAAWRYVYDRFMAQGAFNVIWVWNPFKQENVKTYFPGEAYVDWIGVTALNYGNLNHDGQWRSFDELYEYFDKAFESLPDLPIMLAEFGSLTLGGDRERWLAEALQEADENYKEIKAWVFFHSKWDRNIPAGVEYDSSYLDWTGSLKPLKEWTRLVPKRKIPLPPDAVPAKGIPYTPLEMPEDPIHGVHYKKGQRWFSSHYILDRPTLVRDFRELKQAGVNTVRIEDPGVYTYNLLRISNKQDLQVIYSFKIPDTLDFQTDLDAMAVVRESVLSRVERNKDQPNIIAWNLGNPVWSVLRKQYARPALDGQREAFLTWFADLCREIKKRDPKRRVFADLEITQGTGAFLQRVRQAGIPLDALGLILRDTTDISRFQKLNNRYDLPFYIADARVADLDHLSTPHAVIRSWQDQWEANHVTFDGLLNHRGQPKSTYYKLASRWADAPMKEAFRKHLHPEARSPPLRGQ